MDAMIFNVTKPSVIYKTQHTISDCNISVFLKCLREINWLCVYGKTGAENQFNNFLELFMWAVNIGLPLKNKCVKMSRVSTINKNKWYTQELRKLKDQYNNFYCLAKNSSCLHAKVRYKECKYQYRMGVKKAKLEYNCKLVAQAINKPKEMWKIINENLSFGSKEFVSRSKISADSFNNYFVNSVDSVVTKIPGSKHEPSYYLDVDYKNQNVMENVFYFEHICVEDVHSVILSLSKSDLLDIYNISSKILKLSSHNIAEVLCHIINYCFNERCFPEKLKVVKVIPVHKKGDNNLPSNYRPVSLVLLLSKVIEKLMSIQIINFLDSHQLLSNSQFGFRKNLSTCDAVMSYICNCLEAKEEKFIVSTKFFDLSEAFDTVPQHSAAEIKNCRFLSLCG
ncbi:uncharacterized protein LOC126467413 [Schistocerca serialis cubense]|uniref:uncharacterized protein LOC126467413 n=1 Tax=Schistocerca serialis cubense TaxID=2023355 RepID=UPI00214E01E7|nr:uncharacterized protein LOC126467413 [Schistocerca serialis cubense]